MLKYEGDIKDSESAILFIEWCVRQIGLGFHPDTPFAEYVQVDLGSDDEASLLDALMDKAFEFCDPYQVGMSAFTRNT